MDNSETAQLAPVEPDWNAVQLRYLEGEPLTSIAQDVGTTAGNIATRAWRYRWKQQQIKLLEENKVEVEREVRGSLVVSVLKEARIFQIEDWPSDWSLRETAGKCRIRLLETASKLFNWERDPVDGAKHVRVFDI